MTTKRKARPRRPRALLRFDASYRAQCDAFTATVSPMPMCYLDCRRVAAWLLKAADWLEWKEKNG